MRLLARSFLVGLTIVGASAIFMGACSNQGEGDRCDTQNGNDDCQDGLECKLGKDICCPPDPAQATVLECQGQSTFGGDTGIPPEGSVDAPADAPGDGTTDGETDGASNDSSDDAADANDDGG